MLELKRYDFDILEKLVSLKQKNTKKVMSKFLHKHYNQRDIIETKDFILVKGNIPVALVAHMDTVFEGDKEKRNITYYDRNKGVMWCPFGAGFDDKAGVFAILKIVNEGYRPSIILTTDEEIGGVGAIELISKYPKAPIKNLKYLIELDRANQIDCVFYECINNDFIEYIENFGFVEAFGSFSDIDVICEAWGIAGVNLSIGYKNEHTESEILHVPSMLTTINKVKKMLEASYELKKPFRYIKNPNSYKWWRYEYEYGYDDYGYNYCDKCGKILFNYEAIPVKELNGETTYRCTDCIIDPIIDWCVDCGEAYVKENKEQKGGKCQDCIELAKKNSTKSKKNLKK